MKMKKIGPGGGRASATEQHKQHRMVIALGIPIILIEVLIHEIE